MGNLTITKIVLQEGRKTHFDAMGILTKVLSTAADNDFTLARDLLAMAYADGTISDEEKSAISRLCQVEELNECAVDWLSSPKSNENNILPKTIKERQDYLVRMIQIMGADADSSVEEIYLLELMAGKLGFNKFQLLSIVLTNTTRKSFPGDISRKVLDSFLRNIIDVRGKNNQQNHNNIAKLFDAIASNTSYVSNVEKNKAILREVLNQSIEMLSKNQFQQEDFRRAGLDFKAMLEYEAEKAFRKWIKY